MFKSICSRITVLTLICCIYAGSAYASEVGDGFNGVSFTPKVEYRFRDEPYTAWNKASLAGMIAFYGIGDTASTLIGLNSGCYEANPTFGISPSPWVLIPVKVAVITTIWAVTEYMLVPEYGQRARNWAYGGTAALGFGVTVWNTSQILKD